MCAARPGPEETAPLYERVRHVINDVTPSGCSPSAHRARSTELLKPANRYVLNKFARRLAALAPRD